MLYHIIKKKPFLNTNKHRLILCKIIQIIVEFIILALFDIVIATCRFYLELI